jgi:pimeloyl-ACP methyl ester carboxylesterase
VRRPSPPDRRGTTLGCVPEARDGTLVRANGIELCYDTFGDPAAAPLLLVMGLGGQMIQWDEAFCTQLAERGFHVVRFDNRDVGRSQRFTGGGRLGVVELLRLRLFGTPVRASYTLRDMAEDAVGLLDALGITRAHVVGVSMGGMIAQELAIGFPERLLSVTSIMSTTGDRKLPGPTREAMRILLASPPRTRDEFVQRYAATWNVLRAGSFPEDEANDRERAERTWARGNDPAGAGRQLRAILASGDRTARLGAVKVKALVVHGEVDPLVRPAAGRATAAAIPGAKLVMVPGMGHAMPVRLWPALVDAIATHAHAASTS